MKIVIDGLTLDNFQRKIIPMIPQVNASKWGQGSERRKVYIYTGWPQKK